MVYSYFEVANNYGSDFCLACKCSILVRYKNQVFVKFLLVEKAGYLWMWQFNLYNKLDSNLSEILKTILSKLHILTSLHTCKYLRQHAVEGTTNLNLSLAMSVTNDASFLAYSWHPKYDSLISWML